MDFSDRIDSKRKAYKTSSRRRRKGDDGEEDLGDFSDEEDATAESLQRRIARLQREAEELKAEVARRRATPSLAVGEDGENDADKDSLLDLGNALKTLDAISATGSMTAEMRLAQKLSTSIDAPPTATNGVVIKPEDTQSTSYTITYTPQYRHNHDLAKAVDFDNRLILLESLLGIDALPLPTQDRNSTKPILPTLNNLDRQISSLTTTSASALDGMSKQVRQLTQDAERLDEIRKAAKSSRETLKASNRDSSSPTRPTVSKATATEGLADPEQISKINALYGTLPTIESLAPLLPSVLDRLRSLRLIHADAASASQSLGDVEKRQAEIGEEIKSWRKGLEKVEGLMKDSEMTMGGNTKIVEGWVKELEARVTKLGL